MKRNNEDITCQSNVVDDYAAYRRRGSVPRGVRYHHEEQRSKVSSVVSGGHAGHARSLLVPTSEEYRSITGMGTVKEMSETGPETG